MAKLIGKVFLPALAIVGALLLVLGIIDRTYQVLAVGGCVLLGSVLIAGTRARE